MNNEPDEFGLYHSLEDLYKMKDKIAFMSTEEQSLYADYVCVTNLDDPRINEMVLSEISMKRLHEWNTTSVGNTAYIALNSKNLDIKKFCLKALDIYKKFVTAIDVKTLKELIKIFNNEVDKFKKGENV